MLVYIIRHTKVDVPVGTCYGQSDVPLATSFLKELAHYKTLLPAHFDQVYSSPLQRCQELAKALDYQLPTLEPALMEMNFGDWEGKTWDAIGQQTSQPWMDDFVQVAPPNGENLADFFKRVSLFLAHLRLQPYKQVLVVTHAGAIRCIWAFITGMPLKNIFRIPVDYGEVLVLQLNSNQEEDRIIQKK